MKVWMLWLQELSGYTWLEAAWTDEMTEENHAGWDDEVDRVKKLAYEEYYILRIQHVTVPGVFDLFKAGEATADAA